MCITEITGQHPTLAEVSALSFSLLLSLDS